MIDNKYKWYNDTRWQHFQASKSLLDDKDFQAAIDFFWR